jgi:hypothetical protein
VDHVDHFDSSGKRKPEKRSMFFEKTWINYGSCGSHQESDPLLPKKHGSGKKLLWMPQNGMFAETGDPCFFKNMDQVFGRQNSRKGGLIHMIHVFSKHPPHLGEKTMQDPPLVQPPAYCPGCNQRSVELQLVKINHCITNWRCPTCRADIEQTWRKNHDRHRTGNHNRTHQR